MLGIMESVIDERFRLDLIKYHLDGYKEKSGVAVFFCPLCQFNRPKGKYTQEKGAMFWVSEWNSWRFNCKKCLPTTSMYRYLQKVNPAMARSYQRERAHAGTTGWGHDCPSPDCLVGVSTGSYGSIRSRSAPDSSTRRWRLPVLLARCWAVLNASPALCFSWNRCHFPNSSCHWMMNLVAIGDPKYLMSLVDSYVCCHQ